MKTVFISHVIVVLLFCDKLVPIASSFIDQSSIYRSCLKECIQVNCTNESGNNFKSTEAAKQNFWCKLLWWTCREECGYECMWYAVKSFEKNGYGIQKFHGKWPFIRVMGMQEPASVFASVLNFAANFYMYRKIRREFPLSKSQGYPIIIFWHAFLMVYMNGWVWSTIFHMRDNNFTEFMDYACAFSMVMGLFVAAIVRLCYKRPRLSMLLLPVPLFYFVTHVTYLYTGFIDYEYNMTLNVFFGVCGSTVWLYIAYRQLRSGASYAWRMIVFTVLTGATLALELFDFPPKYDTWDAHALWHLSTSPLPILFHTYLIDDLRYLQTDKFETSTFKIK